MLTPTYMIQQSVIKKMWGLWSCKGCLGRARFEDDTKVGVFYDALDHVAECLAHADRRLCRRFDELATHFFRKRRGLCSGHLTMEFLSRDE
jgi:hypothetical protein